MCDQQVRDAAVAKVSLFVSEGRLFTAWDVTRALREDQVNNSYHNDVNGVVKGMFGNGEMPGYDRQLQDVKGNQALVYHPSTIDPAAYDPDNPVFAKDLPLIGNTAPDTDDDGSSQAPAATTDDADDTDGSSTERLCVPTKYLKALGYSSGGVIQAELTQGKITLGQFVGGVQGTYRTYTVQLNGDLRIRKGTLLLAGIVGPKYTVQVVGDKIEVTQG